MVVSAAGPVPCIASLMLFPLLIALANALVTLIYASLVFGLSIRGVAPIAVSLTALGAAAFASFGLLMAAGVVTFKQTNAGANLIVTALTLVAGFYFPVALLPAWIRWTADVQPFTPAADLLCHFIVGTPMRGTALVKLIAFAAVLLPPGRGRCARRSRAAAGAVRRSSTDMAGTHSDVMASRPEIPEKVVCREFGPDLVALNLESGRYHGLNRTAAVMFERLRTATRVGDVVDELAAEFGQPAARIEEDRSALCRALVDRGLLRLDASAA